MALKSKSKDGFSSGNDLLTHGARSRFEDAQDDWRLDGKSLNSILSPRSRAWNFYKRPLRIFRLKNRTHLWINGPPTFDASQNMHGLPTIDEVTPEEVQKLLGDSTTKQWEFNTAPVWRMKTLTAVFASILALRINISISQATLPSSHKRAIIRPHLKKPGLDDWIYLIQPTTDQS